MKRAFAFVALLLLPVTAFSEDRGDSIDTAAQRCENGLDDAQSWIEACTTAIDSKRYRDPKVLSWLYSNRGFGDINLALQTNGNFDTAIEDLNEAARINPDNENAFLNRANAYMYRGEYQRSMDDTDVVIRLDPKEGKARAVRCTDLTKMGRAPEAIAECRRAIDLGEEHPWSYSDLGAAYEAAGDLPRAADAYRQALSLDPTYADAHEGLERVSGKSPV